MNQILRLKHYQHHILGSQYYLEDLTPILITSASLGFKAMNNMGYTFEHLIKASERLSKAMGDTLQHLPVFLSEEGQQKLGSIIQSLKTRKREPSWTTYSSPLPFDYIERISESRFQEEYLNFPNLDPDDHQENKDKPDPDTYYLV